MLVRVIAYIVFLAGSLQLWGQIKPEEELMSCQKKLEMAQEFYKDGQLEYLDSLLSPCLEDYSKGDKEEALRLLINAFLYDNNDEKATTSMLDLLKLNPEYEVDMEMDSPEFIQLLNRFNRYPYLFLNIKAGVNYLWVQTIQDFELDGVPGHEAFTPSFSGQAGFSLSFPLGTPYCAIVAGTEVYFRSFEFKDTLMGFGAVTSKENHVGLNIPILLQLTLAKGKFNPFLQFGYVPNIMVSSKMKVTRQDHFEGGQRQVDETPVDSKNIRSTLGHSIRGAMGFRWRIFGRHYFHASLSFDFSLSLANNPSQRFSNEVLLHNYLYLDNDFKLHTFQVNLGYTIPFFNPKLKKAYRE